MKVDSYETVTNRSVLYIVKAGAATDHLPEAVNPKSIKTFDFANARAPLIAAPEEDAIAAIESVGYYKVTLPR